jgi:hypothetical protein
MTVPAFQSPVRGRPSPTRLALGFIAAFIATLVFHQGMIALLHAMDLIRSGPFATQAVGPLGVPRFVSLAFWGGVWGIVFVLAEPYFPRGAKYWLAAFLFGAIAPTLFGWFILAPMRGTAVANGWQIAAMWRAPLINGAWGLGTGIVLWLIVKAMRGKP